MMNADLISVLVAVLAVGVSLAGLMLASWRGLRREMREMREEFHGMRQETREEFHAVRQETREEFHAVRQETGQDIQGLRQEIQGLRQETREEFHEVRQEMRDMRNDVGRIDSHIGELRERMGHVDGLLKGLRDVFVRPTVSD